MAFNQQSWGRISGAANNFVTTLQDGTFVGAPNMFTYTSAVDNIAAISAANYFNGVVFELNLNDLIFVVGTDGTQFLTVATLTKAPPAVTTATGVVTGDVTGPASSTDTAVARFSGTTGKFIENSLVLIDNSGNVTGVAGLTATSLTDSGLTASTALVSSAGNVISSSTTTAAELAFVHGVTSAIQTQFTNKISVTSAQIYAPDTGAANAYVVTLSPAPSAYTAGMVVNFLATNANTTTSTLNVNGLGAKTLVKDVSTNLAAGDIAAGQMVTAIYDGTNFQVTSDLGNVVGGIVPLAEGGTSASLTASNGGIFYSTASAGAILAGTATAGQLIQSGANAAPTWTTSTYPATNAINTLLYASAANTMAALATANSGVLVTSASGVPGIGSTLPAAVQQNINNGNLGIPFKTLTVFLTSGTFTPSATTSVVFVKMWGGGGGGGGGGASSVGAGGAGGGYCEGFVTVTPSVGISVTVGAEGNGGATGANGTAGTASVFPGGTTLTANGGGLGANNGGPSTGGTATGGTLNVAGQNGDSAHTGYGGDGGSAPFSFAAGQGGRTNPAAGNAGYGFGGGGGGSGLVAGGTGGQGASGLVLVYS